MAKSFKKLSEAAVSSNKSIVISKNSFNGVTLVQKMFTMDGNREIPIYLKGAFDIEESNVEDAIKALHLAIEEAAFKLGIDLPYWEDRIEEEEGKEEEIGAEDW